MAPGWQMEENESGPLSQVGARRKGESIKRLRQFGETALISVKHAACY
jgi:hypothetical protein